MASAPTDNEDLKKMLEEELDRRQEFSQKLSNLLAKKREQRKSGQQTVEGLMESLNLTDKNIMSQLTELCPEGVNLREKTGVQRCDSGYPPSATSADLAGQRRQGCYLRDSMLTAITEGASRGLPERLDPQTLSVGYEALEAHSAGQPTEHSDTSSP